MSDERDDSASGNWVPQLGRWFLVLAASLGLVILVHRTSWYHQRLFQDLLTRPVAEKDRVARALASLGGEKLLFEALRRPEAEVRKAAERALDARWFAAEGLEPARQLLAAETAMNAQRYDEASAMLSQLIDRHPAYVEALSRRASLRFRMGQVGAAVKDCEEALRIDPNHYGAWHGLGLCHLQLGNSETARKCLEHYRRIQPFDGTVEKWLQRCDTLDDGDRLSRPRRPIEPVI